MKGDSKNFKEFLEVSKVSKIPVYQRDYSWRTAQCKRLYDDIVSIYCDNRKSHFVGSIVYIPSDNQGDDGDTQRLIIDGQQRITSIYLLLKAIADRALELKDILAQKPKDALARSQAFFKMPSDANGVQQQQYASDEDYVQYLIKSMESLSTRILNRCLVDSFAEQSDPLIRLQLNAHDQEALNKLMNNEKLEEDDFVSSVIGNYNYFMSRLRKEKRITLQDFFNIFNKVVFVAIQLEKEDDPQLIFESLNSKGLELGEADKIRNYVLMSESADNQSKLFKLYWHPLMKCCHGHEGDINEFVRYFMAIKLRSAPSMGTCYHAFRSYAEKMKNEKNLSNEDLLKDLLAYAQCYQQINTCKVELPQQEGVTKSKFNEYISNCNLELQRIFYLRQRTVIPYLMVVLRSIKDGKLASESLFNILKLIDVYLFRAIVTDVRYSGYNRFFEQLHWSVSDYGATRENYDQVLNAYLRTSKSRRNFDFVDDKAFTDNLTKFNLYRNNDNGICQYTLERFEHGDSKESEDVFTRIKNRKLTIEHIFPQKPCEKWHEDLGSEFSAVEKWQNRLANLTLTGYNSGISNRPFVEKRDYEEGGFKKSHLHLNRFLAEQERWGTTQLIERNALLMAEAVKLWKVPDCDPEILAQVQIQYANNASESKDEVYTLNQLSEDQFRKAPTQMILQGNTITLDSSVELVRELVRSLFNLDSRKIEGLIDNKDHEALAKCVSYKQDSKSLDLDGVVFFKVPSRIAVRLDVLRKLLELYEIEDDELEIYYPASRKKKTL